VDLAPVDMLPRVSEVHDPHGTLGEPSDHQSVDQDSSASWPTVGVS